MFICLRDDSRFGSRKFIIFTDATSAWQLHNCMTRMKLTPSHWTWCSWHRGGSLSIASLCYSGSGENDNGDCVYCQKWFSSQKTRSCKSVVCEPRLDLNDILWRKSQWKTETETTLFRTEATQQKEHTTHNYSIYSSIAISVHCCLHWCSHLTSIPPSCIGARTLHFSCVPFRWSPSYKLACSSRHLFRGAGCVRLLHHAGSRNHPGRAEGRYHQFECSKAGIVFEGYCKDLEGFRGPS